MQNADWEYFLTSFTFVYIKSYIILEVFNFLKLKNTFS